MIMDYEKKYKEALERAKEIHSFSSNVVEIKRMEQIFPELKESKDERIRKALIILLQHFCKGYRVPGLDFPVSYKDMLTWLEKQSEQKPADTIEQKCEESKTKVFNASTPFEDKLYAFVAACEFLAIPSKIEFILEHSQEILDAAREQIGKEQKPAWSEEDEEMRLTVLQDLQNIKDSYPNVNVEPEFNWLKSLKYRQTVEWEPEDQGKYEDTRDVLRCCMNLDTFTRSAIEADLKWFVE